MSSAASGWSRREFLSAAAGCGGALVIGFALPGCGSKNTARVAAAGAQLNAWLKIGGDNTITVLVDRSEMGQGVYTALPMLLAEELEVDLGEVNILAAPVGDAYVNPGNGGQITGTSNSVSDAWDKLRTAGAQARTMLISAAAEGWQVDPAQCRARRGHVVDAHGRSLSYGELAEAASKLPVPKQVVLKQPGEFTLIGRDLARLDTPGKVDGSAQFGIDVQLPGMLYAALAQSKVLGGSAERVDSTAASGMPGVRTVLRTPAGVVVVADHYWQALRAREALQIAWNPGGGVKLDDASIRGVLHKKSLEGEGLIARHDGDAPAALKAAKKVLRASYELPMLAHAPLEPMNCTADVKADGCDLYVGTQVQQLSQAAAAEAAGLQADKVRVFTTLLGGGFGRRLEVDFIPAAVAASKAVMRPVKLIWTREDEMQGGYYRPPATLQLAGAFDPSGELSAFQFHTTSPSITARFSPETFAKDPFDSVLEGVANYFYGVPNVTVSFSRQEIGVVVANMRSVSHAINCFGVESFMDELARSAGKDPYEFRRALLKDKPRHLRVLETAARRAAWGQAPKGRFQGIALMEGYTSVIAQVAEISLDGDALQVRKIVCAIDCGQVVNPKIIESQMVGGIVFGLSSALWGEIGIRAGIAQQSNFDTYRVLRMNEMPQVEVHLVESREPPGGIGETAVPLVAPAVCNALFAATGTRLRTLPIGSSRLKA